MDVDVITSTTALAQKTVSAKENNEKVIISIRPGASVSCL